MLICASSSPVFGLIFHQSGNIIRIDKRSNDSTKNKGNASLD